MEKEYRKRIDERIRLALETGSSEDKEDSNTLAVVRRKREIHRRTLQRRVLSATAVFACFFSLFGSLCITGFFEQEETQAERISDGAAFSENGTIVVGGDGNGNAETWTAMFTRYEDIPDTYRQEIIWFDDIPQEYETRRIQVKKNDDLLICEIVLQAGDSESSNEIMIEEIKGLGESAVTVLKSYDPLSEINGMQVYFKKEKDREYRVLFVDGVMVKMKSEAGMGEKTEAMIASVRTD